MKQKRYLWFTFFASIFTILVTQNLFLKNDKNLVDNCSYLDPLIIDILAFFGSATLIIEGLYSLITEQATTNKQIFRIIRVIFGCGIFTIHVLQLKHG